jgi:glycosyltransferase involved in cell wall biosynthesis
MKITVGIPAYNEEKNIAKIISRIKDVTQSIIVCDDHSTDDTNKIAKSMGVDVITHSRNMGYGSAIKSIFAKAKEIDSDILVTMDADGQHRIEDLKKILEPVLSGTVDICIGSRFLEKNVENVPSYRKVGIKVLTKLTNVSLKESITDSQSGFRAYAKKAISEIIPTESGMAISNEILLKASNLNLRIGEVPIVVLYDGDTSTHNPVSHGTSVFVSTLKFIAIEHPLQFFVIPGALILLLGLSFVLWALQLFSDSGVLVTNITLIGIACLIFGAILIVNGINLFSIIHLIRENK